MVGILKSAAGLVRMGPTVSRGKTHAFLRRNAAVSDAKRMRFRSETAALLL